MAVPADRSRRLRSWRLLRTGYVCRKTRASGMYRQARMLGTGRAMQCPQARLDERAGWMSECRRCVHWLYDAGFSRQIYALHGSATGLFTVLARGGNVRKSDPGTSKVHSIFNERRTGLAQTRHGAENRASTETIRELESPLMAVANEFGIEDLLQRPELGDAGPVLRSLAETFLPGGHRKEVPDSDRAASRGCIYGQSGRRLGRGVCQPANRSSARLHPGRMAWRSCAVVSPDSFRGQGALERRCSPIHTDRSSIQVRVSRPCKRRSCCVVPMRGQDGPEIKRAAVVYSWSWV